MRNVSIFKKIKLFKYFINILKNNKEELSDKFDIRIDYSYRMYTVMNVPIEAIGEAYDLKKSDIDKISESYIRDYLIELGKFLNSKDLSELYETYSVTKVSKRSYLIIIGFSLFKSNKFFNNIYYKLIPLLIILIGFLISIC